MTDPTPKPELAKGFTCECGTWHDFSPYVYGHWRVELVHTCPDCGAKHDIFMGRATLVTERAAEPA